MKVVREDLSFNRSEDPLENIGIGMDIKNPMPVFNKEIELAVKNPEQYDFNNLSNIFQNAKEDLIKMILVKGLYQELGNKIIKKEKNEYELMRIIISATDENGKELFIPVDLYPSNSYSSFYGNIILAAAGKKGKYTNVGTSYSRSAKSLVNAMKKTLKARGITL